MEHLPREHAAITESVSVRPTANSSYKKRIIFIFTSYHILAGAGP